MITHTESEHYKHSKYEMKSIVITKVTVDFINFPSKVCSFKFI